MKRLVVVIALSAIAGALGALACGPGNEKPPLTPDSEHTDEAGGGSGGGGSGGGGGGGGGSGSGSDAG